MKTGTTQNQYIAVVGNPNCGKTSIFNHLTGLRQKVANYPGVTVERKEGIVLYEDDTELTLLDLPGTYSLSANSPDEKIVSDILLEKHPTVGKPAGILCIVDASNLERGLYLVSQIIDQRYPIILVLNMIDVAEKRGITIDIPSLEERLGVRVLPTIGNKGTGIEEVRRALRDSFAVSPAVRQWKLPELVLEEHTELTNMLIEHAHIPEERAFHEATTLLSTHRSLDEFKPMFDRIILDHVVQDHERLATEGIDRYSVFVQSRIEWIRNLCRDIVTRAPRRPTRTDTIDRIVTHSFWGGIIFAGIMALMFNAVFSWAELPMALIEDAFDSLAGIVSELLPAGSLHDLIVEGALPGTGAVVVFLPQILLLFFFLGILEESGYMARAAFLLDRSMNRLGLSGKAFIPLLSSFACAIPGIMATRTIENERDRFVTILVAPLMSCSARIPVYSLLIAATIPPLLVGGIFNLQGLVMVALYFSGILAALLVASLLKRTLLKGKSPEFILELPPYRIPSLKNILLQMWERSLLFLKRAGTIILFASIILWYLASHPKTEGVSSAEQLQNSYLGKAGQIIEPVLRPLGFDWKISIGILSSFLQREMFVSTMSTLYNIEQEEELIPAFKQRIYEDIDPAIGEPTFTMLTALSVLIFYVIAMQCVATLAVVRRETNSWKWPLFQFAYLTILAYGTTFLFYRLGLIFLRLL